MDEFSTVVRGNPKPGVVFERTAEGERVILNPDISVTVEREGLCTTLIPSYEQWLSWQVDCFNALVGLLPEIKLGEVGIRMGQNYEAEVVAAFALRSFYAA
ncbi:hypothetical protein [Deinococcus apachensis]|uniref:hypothetical protein n=1 Tax=Deinococcus apachensis TaxID=309886 RepID=UPI00036EA36C|nr:hypothetical protein [Deinococcus apachensis]